jgi:hypothetical protein
MISRWPFACHIACVRKNDPLPELNIEQRIVAEEVEHSAVRLRKVKGITVIRQAISCDICGTEKRQTNHWFVAYEQSGELRVGGWNSPCLSCSGTKHLCGETCLHKLISKFMATLVDIGTQCTADWADAAMSADATTMKRVECAEPAFSPWQLSPPTPTWPRSIQSAPRELERLPRSHPCAGRRSS